jgi:hypothetical protein
MSPSDATLKFLAWVGDNYGDQVKLALESEIIKKPCEGRAKLFAKLCEILGTQGVPGIRQAVNLDEIQYDS